MTTLRDAWIRKGMNSVEVAAAAHCSVGTLYKLNRKAGGGVAWAIVKRVCTVLDLSLEEFDALDACPMSERYT